MTTGAGSGLDRALQRLAVAEKAEDATWSIVMGARASFEGARTARDWQSTTQSYFAFVRALEGLGSNITEVVRAVGELGLWSPLDAEGDQ